MHLLFSPLLGQVLHHMEVTFVCYPEQWCPAVPWVRLPHIQVHLRSLHHSLHNSKSPREELENSAWHATDEYRASTRYINLLIVVMAMRVHSR